MDGAPVFCGLFSNNNHIHPDNLADLSSHRQGVPWHFHKADIYLLVTFLKSPGSVLSRQYLADRIWGLETVVTRHTLNEHIKNLREKMGRHGQWIETIPQAGYRFRE